MKSLRGWVLVMACGLAVPAIAQDKNDGRDGLGGPKVKDRGAPGDARRFGKGRDPKQRPFNMGAFLGAVRAMESEKAPENVRLSEEQGAEIRRIHDEFRASLRDYVDEHRAELESLRDQLPERERPRVEAFLNSGAKPGEGPKPGPRPEPGDGMMEERREPTDEEKARLEPVHRRLKEIRDGAPNPADARAQVMALLSDEQKRFVEERMAKPPEPRLSPEQREKVKDMAPEQRREFLREKAKDKREGKDK
jgi:hypothetical protein